MSFEATPTQALLLFGLLAKHGECKQAELMPAVLAKDREALVGAKLIAVETIGRTFHLTLTDSGWGWVDAHFSAELPPAHGTLHDLLERLGEHLARSDETLAAFIGSKPENAAEAAKRTEAEAKKRAAEEEAERLATEKRQKADAKARAKEAKQRAAEEKTRAAAEKKQAAIDRAERLAREKQAKVEAKARAAEAKTHAGATTKKPAKPKAPTPASLRKRIGEIYLAITGGKKNESVKLARLRAEMADLDRATLDAALGRILQGDKQASLMRHDDPRQIDKADEAAAYSPAGEPFHLLWIAS